MKTASEIYNDMLTVVKERTGREISGDCDMAVRLMATAAELESLYIYSDWVKKQSFPQTASGEFLDRHAEMRGIERLPAVKAEGTVRFSVAQAQDSDIEIGAGTVCLTQTGSRFETIRAGVITAGTLYCDVTAEAVEAGKAGNVSANSITLMSVPPVGVSMCVNPEPFSGGADAEDDESLRERVVSSFKKLPNGANSAYYEKEALAIAGVAAVKVFPKRRGLGTVDIVVSSADGVPGEELLGEIKETLEKTREICVDIAVSAPETYSVDVDVKIDTDPEYTFAEVSEKVKARIDEYFSGRLLGRSVTLAELGNVIYGTEGVTNYSFSMPAADVVIGEDVLPVAGGISVSEWE